MPPLPSCFFFFFFDIIIKRLKVCQGSGKSHYCFWAMPKQLTFISILQTQSPQVQIPGHEAMHPLQSNEIHKHSTITTKLETSQAFILFYFKKEKSNGVQSLHATARCLSPAPSHLTLTGNKSQHQDLSVGLGSVRRAENPGVPSIIYGQTYTMSHAAQSPLFLEGCENHRAPQWPWNRNWVWLR